MSVFIIEITVPDESYISDIQTARVAAQVLAQNARGSSVMFYELDEQESCICSLGDIEEF